jgi:cephalosporin hydroxylase
MKILIDNDSATLTLFEADSETQVGLFTKEAFEAISSQWLRIGWSLKYYRNFSWLGLPILQLPEDLLRLQEAIWRIKPKVIVETGIYRGGSLLFHATLLQITGGERVIGIDREIPSDVRVSISGHPLGGRISLVEGDSTAPEVVGQVANLIGSSAPVLVILDSAHTKDHVHRELECYSPFVTPGSYIVATDGITQDLADVPGGQPEWKTDHPLAAAKKFAGAHPEFRHEPPPWLCHDGPLTENVTYWPGAWLLRTGS